MGEGGAVKAREGERSNLSSNFCRRLAIAGEIERAAAGRLRERGDKKMRGGEREKGRKKIRVGILNK